MKKSDLLPHLSFIPSAPWQENANSIWLSSSLKISRNIEKFLFPNHLSHEKKLQLLALIQKTLCDTQPHNPIHVVQIEELLPLEKDFLTEHFLLLEGLQEARQGQACAADSSGLFLALFNVKDHLQLQYTDYRGELEKTWDKLVQIELNLSKTLHFAFSKKFGFLTQDPHMCGTGFTVASYLHLPALIHTHELHETLDREKNDTIAATGLLGTIDDVIGDILLVRNSCSLGMTEEMILSTHRSVVLRLMVAEKHARASLCKNDPTTIDDRVSRALGTLKSSYQLDTTEALQALSLTKLGIEIGSITGMSIAEVNELFFAVRRAHLCLLLNEKIANDDFTMKRAALLREKTRNLIYQSSTTGSTRAEG